MSRYRIRKLTPEECFILMGFSAEDVEKCRDVGVSNSQLYKQAGNSICVTCIEYIMQHLKKAYKPDYITFDEQMVANGYGV